MSIGYFNQPKKYVSIIALAGVISLSGCGGGSSSKDDTSSETSVDTSSLTETKLRDNMKAGITQGVTSSISAVSSVAGNSKVLGKVAEQTSSNDSQSRSLKQTRRESNGSINFINQGDFATSISTDALDGFSRLIDYSAIDQNKNVYTFDPNEAQVCADPAGTSAAETSTAEEIANCQTLLSHITFVVTVTKVENKEVTAANTVFKYDGTDFAKTSFSNSSGHYEILLSGLRPLLLGINDISMDEDKMTIPSTMQGSVRIDFTAPTESSGSLKVSIPSAVKVSSNVAGEETQLDIATTDKLLSLVASSDNNTMEVEVSLNNLKFLMTEKAESGSTFPVQLVLSALTGKAVTTENGDKLMLTGLSADSVKFTVDNLDAMLLDLKPLDAVIDASGSKTFVTLSKMLDLNFSQTNVRHYFSSEAPISDILSVKVKADNGTSITEFAEDTIKVTTGNLSIKVAGVENPFEVDASAGNCLNKAFDLIECPVQE